MRRACYSAECGQGRNRTSDTWIFRTEKSSETPHSCVSWPLSRPFHSRGVKCVLGASEYAKYNSGSGGCQEFKHSAGRFLWNGQRSVAQHSTSPSIAYPLLVALRGTRCRKSLSEAHTVLSWRGSVDSTTKLTEPSNLHGGTMKGQRQQALQRWHPRRWSYKLLSGIGTASACEGITG